ncbi:unnamed protein product [Rhizoctonia solani]|uniref:Nephrocystin 3-like N-terminal domain-containing protein n=1 Tax=Rhizoctonia solani TaxID=456999 RepID=A0A8H3CA36_9AGAM|nr:unnamed protein product [Rhizoctonia solani]
MLIVIDALDECDEPENAIQVLEMLITYASDLPTKFFVSSRSEPQIRRAMAGLNSRMVLHELDDKVVKEDTRVYFRTELAYMSLSEQQISAMVERAGVLFIYAATAVRYIGARKNSVDAKKRLDIVLGVSGPTVSTKDKEIDSLYNAILASAFDDPDLEFWERDRMNNVLHTVICAQEPLTISALARFLEMDESEVRVAVDPLWSVLHVSEDNELIGTLHASFVDYILDSERSKKYTCDASIRHGQLARLCFNRIRKNKSQFNICNLESSYFPDKLVPNIEERVKQAIPLELSYACMYWAVHLELGKDPNAYSEEL